jgi:hypothetical protein
MKTHIASTTSERVMSNLKNPVDTGVVGLTEDDVSQAAGGLAFVAVPGSPQLVHPAYLQVYDGRQYANVNPYGIPGLFF